MGAQRSVGDASSAARGPAPERAARGTARPKLRDAALRLLQGVTLDDLTAFITVGRLSQESGLSSGAIYSAHQPVEAAAGGRPRSAPQVAAREAFLSFFAATDGWATDVIAGIDALLARSPSDAEVVDAVARIVGDHVERAGRGDGGWDHTHLWLSAAVAVNDPEVRVGVAALYRELEQVYQVLIERLLELTDRVTVQGVTVEHLARSLVDAADAGALRFRINPDTEPGAVAQLLRAVFAAMTRRCDDLDDDLPQRLASGSTTIRDDHVRAVASAVPQILDRDGWEEVTMRRVEALTGLDRSTLVGIAPTRHRFATYVWRGAVDAIERRADQRAALAAEVQVVELVHDVADVACSRRSLVASLLQARLVDGIGRDAPTTDQDTDRLVDLLAELLVRLAQGDVGLRVVAARTGVDALLIGAAGSDTDAAALASVLIAGLLPDDGSRRRFDDVADGDAASPPGPTGGGPPPHPPG